MTATTYHQASGMNVMFGFRTLDPDPVRSQALVWTASGPRPYDGRESTHEDPVVLAQRP